MRDSNCSVLCLRVRLFLQFEVDLTQNKRLDLEMSRFIGQRKNIEILIKGSTIDM